MNKILALDKYRRYDYYCRVCGDKLIIIKETLISFDTRTGHREYKKKKQCPRNGEHWEKWFNYVYFSKSSLKKRIKSKEKR